jgi:hypothetical protein
MKQSNFLSLNWRDLLRGLLLSLIAFLFNWLQVTFVPTLDVSPEVKTMILAGLAYLVKNLFTPADKAKSNIVGDRPGDGGGR